MSITTEEQIQIFRQGGRILAQIIQKIAAAARPGVTTKELDKLARELISQYGVQPSFLGYMDFPAVICLSVNDQAVHTPPSARTLKTGDLLKIDMGVVHKGLHTDSAITVLIGQDELTAKGPDAETKEKLRLISVTRDALVAGIAEARPGKRMRDIGAAIQRVIEKNGFKVLKELGGHGIGPKLHEDPFVPNYNGQEHREKLRPGMALALEPISAVGTENIREGKDKFTYETVDGSLSAHFEHTIIITEGEPLIVTE